MRAKTRTNAAMTAYDWLFNINIKVDGTHNASRLALAASDAFFRNQQNSTTLTKFERVTRAHLHASRLEARKTHNSYEAAVHTAGCAHLYSAFYY